MHYIRSHDRILASALNSTSLVCKGNQCLFSLFKSHFSKEQNCAKLLTCFLLRCQGNVGVVCLCLVLSGAFEAVAILRTITSCFTPSNADMDDNDNEESSCKKLTCKREVKLSSLYLNNTLTNNLCFLTKSSHVPISHQSIVLANQKPPQLPSDCDIGYCGKYC